NVAFHLAKAFTDAKDIDLVQRYSRSYKNDDLFDDNIPKTNSLDALTKADIYVIAINDDQIATFSKQLTLSDGLVVHTSGSIPLEALQCKANKGVFYPLQTFSKDQEMEYKHIPICIETEIENDFDKLKYLGKAFSDNVYEINSQQREKLHLAAVFANNFSNYMFKVSKDICDENNFSFEILKPLIEETSQKIKTIAPIEAQTGPAKRNDQKVIKKHLSQLKGDQNEIYGLITKSIIDTYNK
ncbi:MAG: DUF2520 domain-containing protein, partial [Bacteroidota bacterium]